MNLHPETLIVVIIFSTLLMGGAMLVVSRDALGRQIPELAQWGMASLVQSAGWIVFGALRGVLPDVISIVAGHVLLLFSLSWYLLIVAKFSVRRVPVLPLAALIIVEAGLLFYFSAIEKNLGARIVIISTSIAILTLYAAWVVWPRSNQSRSNHWPASHLITAGLFALCGAFMTARAVVYLTLGTAGTAPGEAPFAINAANQVTYLVSYLLATLLTFGFVLMCNDAHATERRQAEASLRRDRERYRQLAATSSEWIWEQDEQFRFIQMEGDLELKTGISTAAHIGLARWEMPALNMTEADWEAHLTVLHAHLPFRDLQMQRPDRGGRTHWVSISGEPIFDVHGRFTGYHGIGIDITARKIAEAAQRESEERYRTLVEWSPEAILVISTGRSILYANPACVELFGAASVEELVGTPVNEVVHPDSHAFSLARAKAIIETGVSVPMAEARFLKRDGTAFEAEVQSTPILYDGKPAIHTVIRDVSVRKREEAVRQSLETQLRESQKMEAIGTLAGGIAHDFNNIIGAILGNVELARQDVTDPRALESLEEIRKAGFRARSMVRQILTFSRRQPTQRVPLSLATIIEESVRLLRVTLPARIVIEWQCDADTPDVLVDATQFLQVLVNLGTNAAYAIGVQAGSIGICVQAATLDEPALSASPSLRELRPGRFALISVSDTGQGMDSETLAHIFEPFFSTKPVGEGTGLGLAVVHGILRTHEGAVVVHSTPGLGCRFDLYLPAATIQTAAVPASTPVAPVATTPAAATALSPAGIGQRVLYVDDDESLLFLTQRLLGRRGYKVTAHAAPDAALAALRADPNGFDLVVTDFNMLGKSGVDVARAVREIRPDLPVAISSGYITDQLRTDAEAAGVRTLIFKPNAVEELCDAVQALILTTDKAPKD